MPTVLHRQMVKLTGICEFPGRKYRSIEVGNVFPSGKLGIQRALRLPTRKYELGNTSFRAQWNAALINLS